MDPLIYQPPLRRAVLFAVGLRQGAVSAETLADLAEVAESRAQSYATILIRRGALLEIPDGYIAGPEWDAWAGVPSRARPHRTYDESSVSVLEEVRRSLGKRVMAELHARGWSVRELARRSGIHHAYIQRLVKRNEPPPATHLVVMARALERSIEELAAPM